MNTNTSHSGPSSKDLIKPASETLTDPVDGVAPLTPAEWVASRIPMQAQTKRKVFTTLTADELQKLRAEAKNTLTQRWADATWSTKTSVWNQYLLWSAKNPISDKGTSMVMFLTALDVKAESTRYRYAKDLRSILRVMNEPEIPLLNQYCVAQSVVANKEDENSALPMPKALFYQHWERLQNENLKCVLWLMWKTASRAGDVIGLRRGNFLTATDAELIVWFGFRGTNKTARKEKFQQQLYCHILEQHRAQILPMFATKIAALVSKDDALFPSVKKCHVLSWLTKIVKDLA